MSDFVNGPSGYRNIWLVNSTTADNRAPRGHVSIAASRVRITVAPTVPFDQDANSAAPSSHASQMAGARNRPNGSREVGPIGCLPAARQAP